jgi:hypothetical protein
LQPETVSVYLFNTETVSVLLDGDPDVNLTRSSWVAS